MKKYFIIIVLILTIICCFGGCKMKGFDSKKEAEKFIIKEMEKKYKENFEIKEVKEYKEEKIGIKWILAEMTSEKSKERKAIVYARNTGEIEDNYHINFFRDDIEKLVEPLCEGRTEIKEYTIEIAGHPSTDVWNENDSLEKYLDKEPYKVNIVAEICKGPTDDEYAKYIYKWLSDLYASKLNIQLTVNEEGGVMIFSENLKDSTLSDFTQEVLVEKIYNWRGTSETIKNYEKWKEENQ